VTEHAVAKAEWGTKRTCLSCGARFYDLRREPIVCPACGATVDATAQSKPRRARATPVVAKVAAVAKAAQVELEPVVVEDEVELDPELEEVEEEVVESGEEAEEDGEEDGESAIEDVSELGDDELTDVIDTEIDEEETDR
jgi:uncharacterized protein (TIGR02300 family)